MSTSEEKIAVKPARSHTALYAVVAVVIVVLLIVVVAYSAGWFKSNNKTSPPPATTGCTLPPSQNLLGAGSTFVYPLMFTWESTYSHSSVNYQSVGSGTGITDLTQKSVVFGASDAPLSPAQQAPLPGKVVTIPETAGGVAIIYNLPGVDVPIQFNGAVLANIYLGVTKYWNDSSITALNPGVTLPSQAIQVVHRSDGSGTSFAFTDFLSKSSTTWATQYGKSTANIFPVGTGAKGSSAVASTVQSTQYSVGYVDLEYALANGIAFGKVQNPSGAFILPTLNDTAAAVRDGASSLPVGDDLKDWYNVSLTDEPGAGDYPITTFSYLLVYEDQSQAISGASLTLAENVVNFLNWTVTYGQADAGQLYYVPLPSNVVAVDQAAMKLITFGGTPVPICTAK
jgi:phosphate transport system substrate-binding protein